MEIESGDILICTVDKIVGTTVFVEIEGTNIPGTIILSEIAAGRIRNIREYVVPNKRIVCKVIRISGDHVELSLRRVTGKERDDVMERYKKEKTFQSLLKNAVSDPEGVTKKIKEKYDISDFIDKLKENPEIASEFLKKDELEKISKVLIEKRDKEKTAKKIIKLNSDSETGIEDIRQILSVKDAEIHYLGSSQYSVQAKALDFKETNSKLDKALKQIQEKAKQLKAILEIKEK